MAERTSLIPAERIEGAILLIRGHKVMLDSDLGAPDKQLPDFSTIPAGLVPAGKGFDDYRG